MGRCDSGERRIAKNFQKIKHKNQLFGLADFAGDYFKSTPQLVDNFLLPLPSVIYISLHHSDADELNQG